MIVLADTSVWVDHFRRGDPELAGLLERGDVVTHPFVVGELMLGNASSMAHVIEDLQALPKAKLASTDEILASLRIGSCLKPVLDTLTHTCWRLAC
jgi:predicted nucleic acid-binding protein